MPRNKVNKVINTAKTFEQVLMDKDRFIKRFAISIAGISIVFCLVLLAAIFRMLPLKERDVALYTVDSHTGRAEFVGRVTDKDISTQEAMAKAFGANYVKMRERYNYFSVRNDYDTVPLFSSNAVTADYLQLFVGDNSPDKVYKNAEYVVDVTILSNVLSPATDKETLNTLRIKRTIRQVQSNSVRTEFWNIRLTFHYQPQKELTDEQREINPLGYIVTSYQRDREVAQK